MNRVDRFHNMEIMIRRVTELRASPNITYTKPFVERADPSLLYEFSKRLGSVMYYFPEVLGEIRIGLTTVHRGLAATEIDGNKHSKKISFPPLKKAGLPYRYIIGHELMHIVQANSKKSIPGTERACDIFALSRLPPKFIDCPPIYLEMPEKLRRNWSDERVRSLASDLMHSLAIEAVMAREKNPRYIRWWEDRLAEFVANGHTIGEIIENR